MPFHPHLVRHGTRSRYRKGCRCELCTRAEAEYQRARYHRNLAHERAERRAVMRRIRWRRAVTA